MSTMSFSTASEQHSHHPFMRTLVARFQHALERQRAIQELESLDDRMLADIGVSRYDIPRLVDGTRF
jgi:uncharacterized protein YjiS (DUF1127 family)